MKLSKKSRTYYMQMIFVCTAFMAMVLVSYLYVSGISRKQLLTYGVESINAAEAEIKSGLYEAEITLDNMAFGIEGILDKGGTNEDIQAILDGVYGYINGEMLIDSAWIPPDDYVPEDRPWYVGAMKNPGQVHCTDPYIDVDTGRYVVSISKIISNGKNGVAGVLTIDVTMDRLAEYVLNLNLSGDGYGMLLNEKMEFVVHKEDALKGKHVTELNSASHKNSKKLVDRMLAGEPVSAAHFIDYDGAGSVAFARRIYNGWYIGLITTSRSYYADVRNAALALSMLGLILALTLCYILAVLYEAKQRSDDKNASKTSFLAKMSHEIRTPMNAITGLSELILRDNIQPEIGEYAVGIKQASDNLLSLINDILDFSKIESGKLKIVSKPYQFASLLNDVVNIVRVRMKEKPIHFAVNIDCDIPNNMIGDETQVRQVLLNLLNNAVKYTKEGYVWLEVNGRRVNGQVLLTIVISDSGVGIRDEDKGKVFQDFAKFDLEVNKGVEGSGLGLAITRSLCQAMGGDITFTSAYGVGSIFRATIVQRFEQYESFARVDDPGEKQVLLYEARAVYADSIINSMVNLGVDCKLVLNQSEFCEELESFEYPFVFVSSFLYQNAKKVIDTLGLNSTLVLLTEYGDMSAGANERMIAMPVHCLSIANILNDVPASLGYVEYRQSCVRFVAPTARILFVDDIRTNLKVCEGLVAPYQMQVDLCTSGEEAVALVRDNHYDIVFMDHMMPGMDGIEATLCIRNLGSPYESLPIIALTANAISGMREMLMQNGMNDFLAKPIETHKLNNILEKWIPKEKWQKYEGGNTEERKLLIGLEIGGLDIRKGLMMTGDNEDNYLSTLEVFCSDCHIKIREMRDCLQNDEIRLLTNHLHALKSASASIGAQHISDYAKRLERAGKNEDMVCIYDNIELFLNQLQALLDNIHQSVCDRKRDCKPILYNDNAAFLGQRLSEFRQSLESMDIGSVDSIINELQSYRWDMEIEHMIDKVSTCVLIYEYEEAAGLVESYLTEIGA